jgi:hypothetical protein
MHLIIPQGGYFGEVCIEQFWRVVDNGIGFYPGLPEFRYQQLFPGAYGDSYSTI